MTTGPAAARDARPRGRRRSRWNIALTVLGVLGTADGIVESFIWASVGDRYFWPRWVWFGWAVLIALVVAVRRGLRVPAGRQRVLALHANLFIVVSAIQIGVSALVGPGFFWPLLALPVLTVVLGVHWLLVRRAPPSREAELVERVDVLTRTRRGVLDVQAAELKRIERDLHDGTQARMVSLAMTLGLAEQLVTRDPDAAGALLAEARSSSLTALEELRTVMRGIQPPVLSDRGLVGAVEALALDLSIPTAVTATVPGRPPVAVESAMYFAVAECLANVVKHSRASRATVLLAYHDGLLSVVVGDDGVGGARLELGTGLVGVATRLEVFDGTMELCSPAGGPTEVIMELPCELS